MNAFDIIVPFLERNVPVKGSVIYVDDHVRVPVKKDAFRELGRSFGRVAFADGGNGDVLRAPNLSVQFCRLCSVVFDGKQRVSRESVEFFVVVLAKQRGLDLVYECRRFGLDGGELGSSFVVDSLDASLRSGSHRVSADVVASHVRKLEEVRFARDILKRLKCGDLLVRDGDLLLSGPFVDVELKNLRVAAENSGVHVLGLSKTSRLCTDSGASAVGLISSLAPAGCWYYFVDGSVGFVKLHPSSRYVFRFDIFSADRASLEGMLSCLLPLSEDPVFLGYPYGLIDVDKSARVSDFELRQLRLRLSLRSGGLFESLEMGVDAHDVLNRL